MVLPLKCLTFSVFDISDVASPLLRFAKFVESILRRIGSSLGYAADLSTGTNAAHSRMQHQCPKRSGCTSSL
jgi:hypothetical protein